jgi:hypothetical protein
MHCLQSRLDQDVIDQGLTDHHRQRYQCRSIWPCNSCKVSGGARHILTFTAGSAATYQHQLTQVVGISFTSLKAALAEKAREIIPVLIGARPVRYTFLLDMAIVARAAWGDGDLHRKIHISPIWRMTTLLGIFGKYALRLNSINNFATTVATLEMTRASHPPTV